VNKKIVVLDDYEQAYKRLSNWDKIEAKAEVQVCDRPLYGKDLLDVLKDTQGLVLMRDRTPLQADLIKQLPLLEHVVFTGTRNLALDVTALRARNISISHTEWGPSKDSTAELTWALILGIHKRIVEQNALLLNQAWRNQFSLLPVLKGQTLGLIGLGEIGGRVAKIAQAFGMHILTWSPHMTPERAAAVGATSVSLDDLLKQSHIVSLHLVASPTTKGLLNQEKLSLMRPDGLLINTSRSTLIDTPALVEALRNHQIGGAALDVFDQEPLDPQHPLRTTPNTLLTPHLGFVAKPVFQSFVDGVVESLEAWLDGKPTIRPLP
jgi:phosphoglycerate dehydrogenase-like enzyme